MPLLLQPPVWQLPPHLPPVLNAVWWLYGISTSPSAVFALCICAHVHAFCPACAARFLACGCAGRGVHTHAPRVLLAAVVKMLPPVLAAALQQPVAAAAAPHFLLVPEIVLCTMHGRAFISQSALASGGYLQVHSWAACMSYACGHHRRWPNPNAPRPAAVCCVEPVRHRCRQTAFYWHAQRPSSAALL